MKFLPLKKVLIGIYTLSLQEKCSYIGYNAKFASRAVFPHGFFGVFISGNAEIGKNCVIYQNVTIGSNILPDSKNTGAPKIGNNVLIGAGATIIGNISIGDNCRIGANCTISRDIPPDSLVIADQPTIIKKENMCNKYYTYSEKGWIYYDDGAYHEETDLQIIEKLNQKFKK